MVKATTPEKNDWLNLPDLTSRLNSLPAKTIPLVKEALASDWANTKIRRGDIKLSLTNTVTDGEELPKEISKTIAASLRSKANNPLFRDDLSLIRTSIETSPNLVIYLYSHYGINAIDHYINIRPTHQASQKQWDEKREEQEINQLDSKRDEVMDEYGMGDLGRGESADE